MHFDNIKYLSFDCYGTLIDWEYGILQAFANAFQDYETVDEVSLLKSFGQWEAKIESGPFLKYREVLTKVQSGICNDFEIALANPTWLADSVANWNPFPDSSLALRHLKQNYKLAILSNVDQEMFAATQQKLDVDFDLVCTSDEIGSYKPSQKNFQFLLDRMDCPSTEIIHVAQSLYHDHVPARGLGITTIWVNRPSRQPGQGATLAAEVQPNYQVTSLAELVQLLMPLN